MEVHYEQICQDYVCTYVVVIYILVHMYVRTCTCTQANHSMQGYA